MRYFFILCLLLVMSGLNGCGSEKSRLNGALPSDFQDGIDRMDRLELFTLLPDDEFAPSYFVIDEDAERFRGYLVLGKAEIADTDQRLKLIKALQRAALKPDDPYACFEPRHGLRVHFGDSFHDYVICFACASTYAFSGLERDYEWIPISGEPGLDFNELVREHGLTMDYDLRNP